MTWPGLEGYEFQRLWMGRRPQAACSRTSQPPAALARRSADIANSLAYLVGRRRERTNLSFVSVAADPSCRWSCPIARPTSFAPEQAHPAAPAICIDSKVPKVLDLATRPCRRAAGGDRQGGGTPRSKPLIDGHGGGQARPVVSLNRRHDGCRSGHRGLPETQAKQ